MMQQCLGSRFARPVVLDAIQMRVYPHSGFPSWTKLLNDRAAYEISITLRFQESITNRNSHQGYHQHYTERSPLFSENHVCGFFTDHDAGGIRVTRD